MSSSPMDRNSLEQAYAFFHQKWRVYSFSTSEKEKDNIEDAISSYAEGMSRPLYDFLSGGREGFLYEHSTFTSDITSAIGTMEKALFGDKAI